jgi:hypothetical protein
LSNFKNIDFIYQSQQPFSQNLVSPKFVTPNNLFASSSTYATNLKPFFFRNQAVNFQSEISKACSD